MNVSLHQSLVVLIRSVSKMEKERNPTIKTQSEKMLSTLALIRALEKEKKCEERRMKLHAPLVRGLN
jgi:hypothetical protein